MSNEINVEQLKEFLTFRADAQDVKIEMVRLEVKDVSDTVRTLNTTVVNTMQDVRSKVGIMWTVFGTSAVIILGSLATVLGVK
jgi:hypothetical protein